MIKQSVMKKDKGNHEVCMLKKRTKVTKYISCFDFFFKRIICTLQHKFWILIKKVA
jgi:hypothetical protein